MQFGNPNQFVGICGIGPTELCSIFARIVSAKLNSLRLVFPSQNWNQIFERTPVETKIGH